MSLHEIRAQTLRSLHRLVHLPLLDLRCVTAQEHLRHTPPLVLCGTCIDGGSEEVILEGIGECTLGIPDHPREQAHDSIRHDRSGELPSGQDVVTYGDLTSDEVLSDTMVDPLVVTAEDDEVLPKA